MRITCVLWLGALTMMSCGPGEPTPEPGSWVMMQDATEVGFRFHYFSSPWACPSDAFWSGTMTMTDVDPETHWFSRTPNDSAVDQPTAEFATDFNSAFTEVTGGYPHGLISWDDPEDGTPHTYALELRSPVYDAPATTLAYLVCGLRLDEPATLEPLPDAQLLRPPESPTMSGPARLFMNNFACPLDRVSSLFRICDG